MAELFKCLINRMKLSENPFLSTRPSSNLEDDSSSEVLTVLEVDLCLKDNHVDHHTSYFNAATKKEALIVRRGEPFRLELHFNRDFSPSKDGISFIFSVADDTKPSHGNGTLNALVPQGGIDDLGEPLEWGAGIKSNEDRVLTVLIKPPANCPVTVWTLEIDTKLLGNGSRTYVLPLPIYVLFNPWCQDDQVYLGDLDQRKEYVMNDTTLIWSGSYKSLHQSAWKVGQFEPHVLECSLDILGTVGKILPAFRGDPVKVARALSALVNEIDDDGILVGNWSKDFSGGVAPFKWTGSTEIIQEFYKTKKPVKYAQCWVYGGVLATIARSLGIPARIITCYSAAHDTQTSLTVDVFVDSDNKKLTDRTTDSIWNFHVWNELWMQRPDLGEGQHGTFDGWQVVDATPQETSDKMYRLGPAPVSAVKSASIKTPYDIGFVFAEVNADILYWRFNGPKHPIKLLRRDIESVGQKISTKAVLEWKREDITDTYKHAERSKEERCAMYKALKQAGHAFSRYYLNDEFNDIEFEMNLSHDIMIGENFSVALKVTNKSETTTHLAKVQMNCDSISYTGKNGVRVKFMPFELELQPKSSEYLRMEISFKEYFKKMSSKTTFRIAAAAQVKNTEFEYYAQDDFRVHKPSIKIKMGEASVVAKKEMDVTMSLENPLPIALRKGVFIVEGPGLEKPLKIKIDDTPVGGTAEVTFKYTPPYVGHGTMVSKFTSSELDDVDGYVNYEIFPRS